MVASECFGSAKRCGERRVPALCAASGVGYSSEFTRDST
jgi:hypothetical protein